VLADAAGGKKNNNAQGRRQEDARPGTDGAIARIANHGFLHKSDKDLISPCAALN